MPYATGSARLANLVRGSSRRIMIMRFRPANIRLINRRLKLPRLLLALSSRKRKDNYKNPTDFAVLTGSLHIRAIHSLRRDVSEFRTDCRQTAPYSPEPEPDFRFARDPPSGSVFQKLATSRLLGPSVAHAPLPQPLFSWQPFIFISFYLSMRSG